MSDGDGSRLERPSAKYYGAGSPQFARNTIPENSSSAGLSNSRLGAITTRRTILLLIIVLLVLGGLLVRRLSTDLGPIPRALAAHVSFPLYFPTGLPGNYELDKRSAKYSSGSLFYAIHGPTGNITVSEQAAPASPPDLKAVQAINTSFKAIDSPAGQAILGLEQNMPTAVISSNTTLITINADKNVPLDAVSGIVKSLSSTSDL